MLNRDEVRIFEANMLSWVVAIRHGPRTKLGGITAQVHEVHSLYLIVTLTSK